MPQGTYIRTEEHNNNISIALLKIGHRPPVLYGKNHPRWKGDQAHKKSFHRWLQLHYGKANKCENFLCTNINANKFEWANIKGHKYSHNRKDYKMLCVLCHRRMDMKKHCRRGHARTIDNNYIDNKGYRHCIRCKEVLNEIRK